MLRVHCSYILYALFLLFELGLTEKIDDSVHYYLSFTSDATKIEGVASLGEHVKEDEDFVRITTKNNEKFVCKVPAINEETDAVLDQYTGPSPDQLLAPLYNEKLCSYLIDTYWTYEVCHGKYVIQFHEEKQLGAPTKAEYYLGNLHVDYATEAKKRAGTDINHPPKRHIEMEDYPYYSVSYTRGTTCDITGKPRTTDVLYICVENMMHKILSVTEVSSCHYEVIIMTGAICSHPAYRLKDKKDREIICLKPDADDEEAAKPRSLQRLDDYHESTFKREYTITHDAPRKDEEAIEESEFESLQKFSSNDMSRKYRLSGVKRFDGKDSLANNAKVVEHTINSILTGRECIVSGQGWWRYEFCYGKQVIQYHQEPNGQRTEIILGKFDEKVHIAWFEESPKERGPVMKNNHVSVASHLYSNGDFCEEAGGQRSVVVQIRCQHSEYSSLAISFMLLEPKTCQYLLMIDSERFCEPLQHIDDHGLIRIETVPIDADQDLDPHKKESTLD